MGSATTQSLAAGRAQLAAAKSVDLETAKELFSVGRVVGDSASLLSALTAFEVDATPKLALVSKLFASTGKSTQVLVEGLVASRWSKPEDLLAAIEDLGIRVAAQATAGGELDEELVAFGRVVSLDHDLELALGSKLSPTETKVGLARKLLANKAKPATVLVVESLLAQPRGRRIGEMLNHAAAVAADQNGFALATVHSAQSLSSAHAKRLESTLEARYGRKVRLNVVVDPAILGGLKVQIGDDVIDGSIAARLGDLRLKLVG